MSLSSNTTHKINDKSGGYVKPFEGFGTASKYGVERGGEGVWHEKLVVVIEHNAQTKTIKVGTGVGSNFVIAK